MMWGDIMSIILLYSDIIISAMRSGSVYVYAVYSMSLLFKYWLSVWLVSKCFCLVYISFGWVMGALVW